MVPLESSKLFNVLDCFTDAIKMRKTSINNQDSSGDDTCSISDPTTASTTCYNISSCPVKDNRSINMEDKDKSWLRLGIGPEYQDNTASYKLNQNESRREKSLDLTLFSSSSSAAVTNSLNQPQTLGFSLPCSRAWIPQYTVPFREVNSGIKSCGVEERGGEPSSEIRVLDTPRRPRSGLWFILQASQFQEKEPFLPQVNKSYLRIKDGRITVRLLIKYLMKKLQLDNESEIEIRCRGQQLSPLLTMQHVRDCIWTTPKSSSSSFTLLRDSSTTDHVMILHYGRTA